MKAKKNKLVLLTAALAITSALGAIRTYAGEGDKGGSGGDPCENRFLEVRDDLAKWITGGGHEYLKFPETTSVVEYKSRMLDFISGGRKAQVSCVSDVISVNGAEKTCKNFVNGAGQAQIVCNAARFMGTKELDQYVLVHHEYAGLAGIEVNRGAESDYVLSNQVSGYLHSAMVKRLAISPSQNEFAQGRCKNAVDVPLNETVSMRFCEIPAGSAVIGDEKGEPNEKPAFARTFKSFQMGQFVVTQSQYKALMGDEPWREDGRLLELVVEGATYPAVHVSYNQVQQFARALSIIDPGAVYRLPTEAEFEYAARAGTTTSYYWGNEPDPMYAFYFANTKGANPREIRDVMSCPMEGIERVQPGYCANQFGLMHMLDGVWHWTADAYVDRYSISSVDGNVPVESKLSPGRVIRGGSFSIEAKVCRSADRDHYRDIPVGNGTIGFRLVRIPKN